MPTKPKVRKKPAKEEDDFQQKMYASLRAHMPRSDAGGICELTLSDEEISSGIRYMLNTGIESFDSIVGGMPFGRIVEIFGLEGCGKTAMAIRCAVRAQLKKIKRVKYGMDGKITYEDMDPAKVRVSVVYIDNESSLSEGTKIEVDGVKLKCIVLRTDTIDQVFKKVSEAIQIAQQEEDLDDGIIRFTVILIDTIASTSSREELNASWDKRDFPRLPGEISRGFSKLVRKINQSNVCLICTNQVRTNYKASTGAPGMGRGNAAWRYSSMGGLALRFYASHRVFMQALGHKYKLKPTSPFSSGIKIGFNTVKNRHHVPERDGRMVLLYVGKEAGLNNVYSTLETLVHYKFIEVGSKEKGTDYTVKFSRNGIATTTFDASEVANTLDEEDDLPRSKRRRQKDPGFKFRAEWPEFYADHMADIDALWSKAMAYVAGSEDADGAVDEEALADSIFDEND